MVQIRNAVDIRKFLELPLPREAGVAPMTATEQPDVALRQAAARRNSIVAAILIPVGLLNVAAELMAKGPLNWAGLCLAPTLTVIGIAVLLWSRRVLRVTGAMADDLLREGVVRPGVITGVAIAAIQSKHLFPIGLLTVTADAAKGPPVTMTMPGYMLRDLRRYPCRVQVGDEVTIIEHPRDGTRSRVLEICGLTPDTTPLVGADRELKVGFARFPVSYALTFLATLAGIGCYNWHTPLTIRPLCVFAAAAGAPLGLALAVWSLYFPRTSVQIRMPGSVALKELIGWMIGLPIILGLGAIAVNDLADRKPPTVWQGSILKFVNIGDEKKALVLLDDASGPAGRAVAAPLYWGAKAEDLVEVEIGRGALGIPTIRSMTRQPVQPPSTH